VAAAVEPVPQLIYGSKKTHLLVLCTHPAVYSISFAAMPGTLNGLILREDVFSLTTIQQLEIITSRRDRQDLHHRLDQSDLIKFLPLWYRLLMHMQYALLGRSIIEVHKVKTTAKTLIWALGGALSFWLPIIIAFAIGRFNTNMVVANVLALFGASLCYAGFRRLYRGNRFAVWMLIGLYLFGPILLSAATSFVNGGFLQVHSWKDIGWLSIACVFPPIQLLLAGASGVWPSLVIVTAILGINGIMQLRSMPRQSPAELQRSPK